MKFSLVPALAFLAATFAGAVHAQNVSQCLINCIGQAAASNGCDLTNTQCLCTNSKLQQDALSCLQQSCTAQDLQNAESLVQTECAGFTSNSISFPAASSGTGSASATTPATSQTQTQSQNAAAPTAYAKAKMGAAIVAIAVGAVIGL